MTSETRPKGYYWVKQNDNPSAEWEPALWIAEEETWIMIANSEFPLCDDDLQIGPKLEPPR